ncbi:MAG: glucose 1-dehydrogenase [Pseudomonadota bacterium]
MGRLDGKSTVITGGASGMGLATVERFLAEGASVVVGDLNEENGATMLQEAEQNGTADRLRFIKTDVSEEKDIEAMVAMAVNDFGRLDAIFNNAGIGGAIGPVTEVEVEHWDYTFAVLTRSVFLGIKHAARAMINQGDGGSIISTASIAGMRAGGGPMAYSAAKSAVINITQNSAMELAQHRIRVNCICPGMIFTPLMHRGNEERAESNMKRVQPWPDRGEGRHIAAAALYLADDDSEFVTGEAHVVDGGYNSSGTITQTSIVGPQHRHVGITHGSTGKAPDVRRLDES